MPVTRTVTRMTSPSLAERNEAAEAGRGNHAADAHSRYLRDWPALTEIELRQPENPSVPSELIVGAWNIERCKRVEESASLIRGSGADVVLTTEMDWGMARSSQRHTAREVAAKLGMGYAFGVEFVELGTGDLVETKHFSDMANDHGLHGNAILSRLPFEEVTLIPIDDGGYWFRGNPKKDGQLRVGGRMAMAAKVSMAGGPIVVVSVHFESESNADERYAQTEHLLEQIMDHYGDHPCVIGGDLNTAELTGLTTSEALSGHHTEPCFASFEKHGFQWRGLNTGRPTVRAAPGEEVRYPLMRLDWILARGVTGHSPQVVAALCERGEYLSDHELITARFSNP